MIVLHIGKEVCLIFLKDFVLNDSIAILDETFVDASLVRELDSLNFNCCDFGKLISDFHLQLLHNIQLLINAIFVEGINLAHPSLLVWDSERKLIPTNISDISDIPFHQFGKLTFIIRMIILVFWNHLSFTLQKTLLVEFGNTFEFFFMFKVWNGGIVPGYPPINLGLLIRFLRALISLKSLFELALRVRL